MLFGSWLDGVPHPELHGTQVAACIQGGGPLQ